MFAAGTVFVSACTVMAPGKDFPTQGKVWRGDVVIQYYDLKVKDVEASLRNTAHFENNRDLGRRMAKVRVLDGGFFKDIIIMPVNVPDSVEYSDLTKGAIVDIIMVRGTVWDYRTNEINRIVKLVCAGSDSACIKAERSAGRVNTVIDEHPVPEFTGGNTYLRRISPEERKTYE